MHAGRAKLAIVGVGNTLAGDDGAGIEAVRRLGPMLQGRPGILLYAIEGDHFEIADLLDRAERFIFVDAVAGERPGERVRLTRNPRAFAPSFHQTDIASVMRGLEALRIADPFPSWEIWGITILPPEELGEGLSPEVDRAVDRLCADLWRLAADTFRG
jgi:hydrogenase maturation protease